LEGKKMTKKDFELIAEAIKIVNNYEPTGSPKAVLSLTVDVLADVLGTTNPLFDRAKFLTACGVN
jgi:hypothetical protein